MKKKNTRWQSCNVLQSGSEARRLWHFTASRSGLKLEREQSYVIGEPLPPKLVTKDWRHLVQPCLNIALLPPDKVFFRVVHLPKVEFDETIDMVELQLEKLSPLPVPQVVWTIHTLPHPDPETQTVVVTIVSRGLVEGLLDQLQEEGYLGDRIEVSLFDQILATPITGEGAWVYPQDRVGRVIASVAWWYGGALQQISVIDLPEVGDPAPVLKDQLAQMIWAAEVEEWLTTEPKWHLVAEGQTAAEWKKLLTGSLDEAPVIVQPIASSELVTLTARRAASASPKSNLLPAEYSDRYRQQLVDQVWMRGISAVIAVYLVAVVIYFAAVQFVTMRTTSTERQAAALGLQYTNTVALKQKYEILKERQELKFAALDCWRAVANTLPVDVVMQGLDFKNGRVLTLNGTVPADRTEIVTDFYEDLRTSTSPEGRAIFNLQKSAPPTYRTTSADSATWTITLELNRPEET